MHEMENSWIAGSLKQICCDIESHVISDIAAKVMHPLAPPTAEETEADEYAPAGDAAASAAAH
jgi:hypothetical protein